MSFALELTDLDRRIWEEELEEFVPPKIFDAHSHIYRWDFHTDPEKENGAYVKFVGTDYREVTFDFIDRIDAQLMPGREVHRLSFPFPSTTAATSKLRMPISPAKWRPGNRPAPSCLCIPA